MEGWWRAGPVGCRTSLSHQYQASFRRIEVLVLRELGRNHVDAFLPLWPTTALFHLADAHQPGTAVAHLYHAPSTPPQTSPRRCADLARTRNGDAEVGSDHVLDQSSAVDEHTLERSVAVTTRSSDSCSAAFLHTTVVFRTPRGSLPPLSS
jgi:hypothetical protein